LVLMDRILSTVPIGEAERLHNVLVVPISNKSLENHGD